MQTGSKPLILGDTHAGMWLSPECHDAVPQNHHDRRLDLPTIKSLIDDIDQQIAEINRIEKEKSET